MTPTAQDVAKHHKRWNTSSTALALYWHDWKFSVPLKHLLCPDSQVFRASRSHWQDVRRDDLVRTPPSTPAAAAASASAEKPLDTGHCMHATTRPTRITHRLNECSCARLLVWGLVLQNGPAYITARLSFHRLMTQDHSCVCVLLLAPASVVAVCLLLILSLHPS